MLLFTFSLHVSLLFMTQVACKHSLYVTALYIAMKCVCVSVCVCARARIQYSDDNVSMPHDQFPHCMRFHNNSEIAAVSIYTLI